MVDDTNVQNGSESETKCCSKCEETKEVASFIKNRNVCKSCSNNQRKAKYNDHVVPEEDQECTVCNETKPATSFVKRRTYCIDCNNKKRREKYETDEEHRVKAIAQASEFKRKKVLERADARQKFQEEIGVDNSVCKYCKEVQTKTSFRHNRQKCKGCERDEPIEKFKRNVRSRIYHALNAKNKHTIEYLGCSSIDYFSWIMNYTPDYNLSNHGKEWHIDHVIPLSKFDLDNEQQQLIAFNWRNTMPLSAKENLSKNNKIIVSQIEQHQQKLLEYHTKNKILFPQEFNELYAKHLVAGSS